MMSDYLRNAILNQWLAGSTTTLSGDVYAALSTGPAERVLALEPSTGGYARVAMGASTAAWLAAVTGWSYSAQTCAFPNPTAAYGPIESMALMDASTSGNELFSGDLVNPQALSSGGSPLTFPTGTLAVGIDGCISDYWRNMILDYVLRGASMTWPGAYLALSSTQPNSDTTTPAINVTEPTAAEYARINIFGSMLFEPIVYGVARNQSTVQFANPTSATGWGTYPYIAVFSALTSGQLLTWGDNPAAPTVVQNGQPVQFLPGQLKIEMDSCCC